MTENGQGNDQLGGWLYIISVMQIAALNSVQKCTLFLALLIFPWIILLPISCHWALFGEKKNYNLPPKIFSFSYRPKIII